MGRGHHLWERLTEDTILGDQPMPIQPIVEIAGDRRVLIENHMGVMEYGQQRIMVKMRYGCICVCGCRLELARMTKEQLIITGRIDGISLQRREKG